MAFPPELLEQGVGLALSGLANSVAFQKQMRWILPFWAERQLRPRSRFFIPSGVNVFTVNLTGRNWVSLGCPGNPREAMVDEVGMVSPGAFESSLLPYVKYQGQCHVPGPQLKVEQSLESRAHVSVRTVYDLGPELEWSAHVFCVEYQGMCWVAIEQSWLNRSGQKLAFQGGFALRPYNILSLAPIFRLKYKEKFWRLNQKAFVYFPEEPHSHVLSRQRDEDPFKGGGGACVSAKDASGWMAAHSEWDLELAPSEQKSIWCLMPLRQDEQKLKTKHHITAGLLEYAQKFQAFQPHLAGAQMILPDADLQKKLSLLRRRWHVFDDQSHFSPGTYFYHQHWIRDSAFIALAFGNWGNLELLRPKLNVWLSQQRWNGEFRSHAGEWDSTGQAVYVILNYVRCGVKWDLELDDAALDLRLEKAIRWILKMRQKARPGVCEGLLPAGFSAEHFGPNDQYLWDNLWSLAACESWISWLKDQGRLELLEEYAPLIQNYAQGVQNWIDDMSQQAGGALPSAPRRALDASSIGNLVASQPLDLQSISMHWLEPTLQYLKQNHLVDGLFYQPISHTGKNIYLSVQLARAMQALGDMDWWSVAGQIWEHASSTYTWPEAIHPNLGGGCMGDGDHGWALAEVLELYRSAFYHFRGGVLNLFAALPLQWWDLGLPMQLRGFKTPVGELDMSAVFEDGQWVLSWNLVPGPWSVDCAIYVHFPRGFGLEMGDLGLMTDGLQTNEKSSRLNLSRLV